MASVACRPELTQVELEEDRPSGPVLTPHSVVLQPIAQPNRAARADSVLVLNSEEASYSILSRSGRVELARLPVGREPHHLIVTPVDVYSFRERDGAGWDE